MALPNEQQVLSAVRWIIATFGPIAVSYGYATSSGLEMLGGIVISLIPLIWGQLTHTEANAVATVAKIASDPASPVKGVVVEESHAGHEMVKNVVASNPTAVIASAGTNAAELIAGAKKEK